MIWHDVNFWLAVGVCMAITYVPAGIVLAALRITTKVR